MERNSYITLGEIFYLLFFGLLLFAKGAGLYDGQNLFKLVLVAAVLCLCAKICIESYTISEIIWMFLIVLLSATTYVASGEKGLLLYALTAIGMKNVDIKRVFGIGCILWTLSFLGLTVSSLFHMEDTVFKVHAKLGMGHIVRWSLGYAHPNVLHISYVVFSLFVIYLLGDKFRIRDALLIFLGNCLIFLFSVSYTGFTICTFLLVGRIYFLFRNKLCKFEKFVVQLIYPISVFFSLLAPITIKGKLFIFLNELLSTRMELAWRYLKPQYVSLFGIRISEIITESLTMDNAYLFAFITYGIIPFCVLCLCTLYMIWKYLKEDKYLEILIIVTITLAGLTEPFLYNTSFKNLSFLFMGNLLFGKQKSQKEIGIFPQWNRKFNINTELIETVVVRIKSLINFSVKKCTVGVIIAILILISGNCVISYPEGYVFYRTDCADVTKNKHYYEENNQEYSSYRKMGDFKIGDEIEYFSGNIVIMEHIRYNISSIVLGYVVGYILCGIWLEVKCGDRKEIK